MQGRIYIAGVFDTITPHDCGEGEEGSWVDNDPHIWSKPYTWGICRWDLRRYMKPDDYIFFVLPANATLPQMIFAYLKVAEIISHVEAYQRKELRRKRMGPKKINGNIMVDTQGNYNQYDAGIHRARFHQIKQHYVVADSANSQRLTKAKIKRLAPSFVPTLNSIFGTSGTSAKDVISRWGRVMSADQVKDLLEWMG